MPILIVDDDLAIRDVLTELLEDEGYRAVAVSDGMKALDYLWQCQERPCLILLDLMMSILNGWEFRDRQMKDPAIATIPVTIISAAVDDQQGVALLGVDHYLSKPLDLTALLATVQRYCAD